MKKFYCLLFLLLTLHSNDCNAVNIGRNVADMKVEGVLLRMQRDMSLNHYVHPESPPRLRATPTDHTITPGKSVSLKCSATGSPIPVITWTRDHQTLLPSHRLSVVSLQTAMGEVVSHVNLSDVTVREGGTYTCTAHNTHGSQAHSVHINIYGPAFVRAMGNISSVAGEDVQLWCPAGGYPAPSVTWHRASTPLPTSPRQKVLLNGTLVIVGVTNKDAGRYSCVVTGKQGQTQPSHTYLQVLEPPSIEPFSFRQDLLEGDRTQLTCMVESGDLPMTINWLKDGRPLQHDPDINNKLIHDYSKVLLFTKLKEHHSGSYTCKAANSAATTNHTATVRIKVPPKWIVEPSSGTALVGSTVVIDCNARGHPQPIITWMKARGDSSQDYHNVVLDGLRISQANNGSLLLHNIDPHSAGWYRCTAANGVADPLASVIQLTVHAPARVVSDGGRVTGHAGQLVRVTCEATGDHPLTLNWKRHHTPISSHHRVVVEESTIIGGVVRSVLKIKGVRSSDAGPYTCVASNPHGHHSQIYNVAVIEPPTAPGRVEVSEVSSRSARISWTLPQPAAVTIQYKGIHENSWLTHGRNVSVGQWAASHLLSGLNPHTTYQVRLMAHNDLGVSQPSDTHSFTTTEEAPSGAPRDVQVRAGGPGSLVVMWRAPPKHLSNGALRGYIIAIRAQNLQGKTSYISRPITAFTDNGDIIEKYEVNGLMSGTLYEVALRAFNRVGYGPLSSPRIVEATRPDAPLCAPTGVSCRGSGVGSVRVWWSPPPVHCVMAPVQGYTVLATPTTYQHTAPKSRWEASTTNLEKNLGSLPPATNISVSVRAFNEAGGSTTNHPIFCLTEDDVPGPPRQVRVTVTGSRSVLVSWSPPYPYTGTILHYTLYSTRDNQMTVRDLVGATGSDTTWKEITGLTPASRVQVWVTATTVAGEGSQSSRLTAVPKPTPTHTPVAVGGERVWRVGVGSGVTLGCRGLGTPKPKLKWYKNGDPIIIQHFTQILPGGDLHLSAIRESANYTCVVRNTAGTDTLTHEMIAITPPLSPSIILAHATHSTLNLTISHNGDGGAPILGYTVHHRGRAGEWMDTIVDGGMDSVMLRGLACGAPHHTYVTAWNAHGTSKPSTVLVASTLGSPPGRPEPASVVEVNATCITLRLYMWPELGCPVTHWKVERESNEAGKTWQSFYGHVGREKTDLGMCDVAQGSWHLIRITASSTAGQTTVVYRVATTNHSGGLVAAESIQEVVMSSGVSGSWWVDAHVVAGIVSAILLALAIIICVCVAIGRHRYGGYSQGESVDEKVGVGEDDNARNCELTRTGHLYSPTPIKKQRGSLASLKTQDDSSDPYEICPYATFSDRRSQQQPPAYGQIGRQRAHTHYKDSEISYISSRSRGEYGSRCKSMSDDQSTINSSIMTPDVIEQQDWTEEVKKVVEEGIRESSNDSNSSSPTTDQRPQYQHLRYLHHLQAKATPLAPSVVGGVRVVPHPLPPVVHHPRAASDTSSSDDSPLTPPRPLHPPSAFSDSRELSEAECDREVRQAHDNTDINTTNAAKNNTIITNNPFNSTQKYFNPQNTTNTNTDHKNNTILTNDPCNNTKKYFNPQNNTNTNTDYNTNSKIYDTGLTEDLFTLLKQQQQKPSKLMHKNSHQVPYSINV